MKNAIQSGKKWHNVVYDTTTCMWKCTCALLVFACLLHFCWRWSSPSFTKSFSQHGSEMNRRWNVTGGFCMAFFLCFWCICRRACCFATCTCDKSQAKQSNAMRIECKRTSAINVCLELCAGKQVSHQHQPGTVFYRSKHCAFPYTNTYKDAGTHRRHRR